MGTTPLGDRSHQIPPKASIRRGPTTDDEVFGEAFNGQVVGRFIKYVAVYKKLFFRNCGRFCIQGFVDSVPVDR